MSMSGSMLAKSGATAGAGLLSLLMGGSNPYSKSMSTLGQIPGQVSKLYQPYMSAGTQALPTLEDQYTQLLTDPGAMFNQMGQSFQQSPGFNFAMQQALQGSNQAAAAGGMAGSPQHEQQNQQLATNLADQDYYNYMNQVMGLYGKGLSGEQGLAQMGLQSTQDMSRTISNIMAGQAMMQAQAAKAKGQSTSSGMAALLGGLTSFL